MSGRIRTIKPEILEDEVTALLPDNEWRLFVSLWLLADDYGNLRCHPLKIQGAIYWGEKPSKDVGAALTCLADKGLIQFYRVRGQVYAHVVGWERHQKIDHPSKPWVPGPEDEENAEELHPDGGSSESLASPRETLASPRETYLRSRARAQAPKDLRTIGPKDHRKPDVATPRRAGAKPATLQSDWKPDPELLEALASKHDVDPERIRRVIPEFIWYWTRGDGTGKRRSQNGWAQTFGNRIGAMAKSGELYAGSDRAKDRKRAAESNDRQKAEAERLQRERDEQGERDLEKLRQQGIEPPAKRNVAALEKGIA